MSAAGTRRVVAAASAAFASVVLALAMAGVLGHAEHAGLADLLGAGGWFAALLAAAAIVPAARGRYGAFRLAADSALLVAASSAASLLFGPGAGGMAGDLLGEVAASAFGHAGGAALLVAAVGLALAGRFGRGRVRARRPAAPRAARQAAPPAFPQAEAIAGPASVAPATSNMSGAPFEFASESEPPQAQHVCHRSRRSVIRAFALPGLDVLPRGPVPESPPPAQLAEEASVLEDVLASYDVGCKVEMTSVGPSVVTFEGKVAAGTKVGKVIGLASDLALAFGRKVRVTAGSRPGRLAFEVERERRASVGLRELCEEAEAAGAGSMTLPVALGRGTRGEPVFADLAEMPHVIVAGATGSGKSVCLNAMLLSLLLRKGPDELRLLLIDPKVVELQPYGRVPHMLAPVLTDMDDAMAALGWAVREMERRYSTLAAAGKKSLVAFNRAARGPERLPHILVVVDEFADLVAAKGKTAEALIARLAQKARAAGIHLVLATQRPSVDVITGTIKANFPSRIALRVAQRTDSRTILDDQGAEHLCGRGDMLAKLGGGAPIRAQGPMVTEAEIDAVTDALAAEGPPYFEEDVLHDPRDAAQVSGRGRVAEETKVWS